MTRTSFFTITIVVLLFVGGCFSPKINLFPDGTEPLREFVLEGKGKTKVLLISVKGFISDDSEQGFMGSKASIVEKVVSQLRKAEEDEDIRAIVLKIDSPGGTVTASDLLYHEISEFKKRSGAKVVVAMMDVAASGGYYVSLPADTIMAHPTTVTGSVGVVFVRPKVRGLMEKIGLDVEISKSGKNKDMGSPFREATDEEQALFQGMIRNFSQRFLGLVEKHRHVDENALSHISTARVCTAERAKELGLVDEIGYLDDAVDKAKSLAGLGDDAKVVVYRRTEYPEDNFYKTSSMEGGFGKVSLVNLSLPDAAASLRTGFYYLWLPD